MAKTIPGLSISILLAPACGANHQQLQARAAFDLGCHETQIHVVELDERTRGVMGCGKKATYVESCEPNAFGRDFGAKTCTWVLNAEPTLAQPPPGPPPGWPPPAGPPPG